MRLPRHLFIFKLSDLKVKNKELMEYISDLSRSQKLLMLSSFNLWWQT